MGDWIKLTVGGCSEITGDSWQEAFDTLPEHNRAAVYSVRLQTP